MTALPLSATERAQLAEAFKYVTNYDSDDPTDPIDPVTYRAPDGDTCLHIAAMRGDAHSTALLIKAGVDVNALGDMGSTPLHYADDPKVVDLLLSAGAADNVINEFGQTPLEARRSRFLRAP
jgi:ankyrin repeat protein